MRSSEGGIVAVQREQGHAVLEKQKAIRKEAAGHAQLYGVPREAFPGANLDLTASSVLAVVVHADKQIKWSWKAGHFQKCFLMAC